MIAWLIGLGIALALALVFWLFRPKAEDGIVRAPRQDSITIKWSYLDDAHDPIYVPSGTTLKFTFDDMDLEHVTDRFRATTAELPTSYSVSQIEDNHGLVFKNVTTPVSIFTFADRRLVVHTTKA